MKKEWLEFIIAGVIGISIALIIRFYVVEIVKIEGSSMLPAFKDRDIALMEKISYAFSEPKRGESMIRVFYGKKIHSEKSIKKNKESNALFVFFD